MDDPRIKHPGADCLNCPYLEIGKYVPPLMTSVPPELIVLGEAPGANEARTGIPFTGASGQLLNKVLEHYNIDPEKVIKENTILCRPEGPTEKPPKKAIEACSNRLHTEIKASGAKTILAVGATAAHAVLNDTRKITQIRIGDPRPYKFDRSIRVIPSVHPAFCLRSPDNFPTFVKDVGKITAKPRKSWVEPAYKVVDDEKYANIALDRLVKLTDVGVIDIEAGIDKDFDSAHPEDYQMLCVGVAYDKAKAIIFGENALKYQSVRDNLRNYLDNTKLIGHNLRFDIRGLSPLVGIVDQWFDTMLASRSVDERPGQHGLKQLAVEILGAPKYDDVLDTYLPKGSGKNYANVPRNILYKYNAFDVGCTWDLFHHFDNALDERARKELAFMMKASNQLIHLELAGIHFDLDYNEELYKEYSKIILDLEDDITNHVDYVLNPRSPQQVKAYLSKHLSNVETTDKEFLTAIRKVLKNDEVNGFIDLLLEHRKASKLQGTYIKGLAKRVKDEKVYTTYSLHGTTSGRIASRRPNMQNIAKNVAIRNQFTVEDPNNVLIQIDYSQIEGRTIATLAQDDYLRDIFNDPKRDLFNELISQIYGAKEVYDARRKIKSVWYGFCVPLDTKILTRRGWLTHDQVIPGVDETIGYDQELQMSRWTKVNNVVRFDNVDVVKFGNNKFELEATPNHRWLSTYPVRTQIGNKLTRTRVYHEEFVETQDIKTEHVLQFAKQFTSDTEINITDTHAFLLGVMFADAGYEETAIQEVKQYGINSPEEFALSLSDNQRSSFMEGVSLTKSLPVILKHSGTYLARVIRIIGYLEGSLVKTKTSSTKYEHKFTKPEMACRTVKKDYAGKKDVWCVQTDLGTWTMEQNGLIVLTGNSYGRGAKSISEELDIPVTEAQELISGFKQIVKKTVIWQENIKRHVLSGKDLVTPFGRKRSFYLITNENKVDVINEALSFLPQSIASDICLSAMVILRPLLDGIATIRLTVHDALVFECHKDNQQKVIEIASKVMVEAAEKFTKYVRFAVDATVATRLGEL